MSECWEIIMMMCVFTGLLQMQIHNMRRDTDKKLRSIQGDLYRIEDKIDGFDRGRVT